jgi:hypothetical protein
MNKLETLFTCHGAVTNEFRIIAKFGNYLKQIRNGEIPNKRFDCYGLGHNIDLLEAMLTPGITNSEVLKNAEIFCPSNKYPPHADAGGISYMIPLEDGEFYIGDINYPIIPFVLYSFEDSVLHNTNFAAIMLK